MTYLEHAILFDCAGDELVGIVAVPGEMTEASSVGVLVVVGGPQYRVGSHRMFVTLARCLAGQGIPCMRFDYRGMGDSCGEQRSFTEIEDDIRAAINAFLQRVPTMKAVVIWGLCDAASAACFYCHQDRRVAGLVLLNPWVRTAAGEAKTMLRHYYLQRLLDPSFWRKALEGRLDLRSSVRDFLGALKRARTREARADTNSALPVRLVQSLLRGNRPFALLLSGRDYVAQEFEDRVFPDKDWQAAARKLMIAEARIDSANHTLARAEWKAQVGTLTAEWVRKIAQHPLSASAFTRHVQGTD